tara:strand:+ start:1548 stop:5117 length:3570 start_codon:yes stop_codon:yes gene_type:complete
MEIIKKVISRGSLLGDTTNARRPVLDPEPILSNGVSPYPCTDSTMSFDDCVSNILNPLYTATLGGDWMEEYIDSTIIDLFGEFVSEIFSDDFSQGTQNWEPFSLSFPLSMVWNTVPPYAENFGNNSIRIEIGGPGPVSTNGIMGINTINKYSINANENYNMSVRMSSNILSHINMVANPGVNQPGFLFLFAQNVDTGSISSGQFNENEVELFISRGIVNFSFTAPDGGNYKFGLSVYVDDSLGTPAQIGDFLIVDDFRVVTLTSVVDDNSFNSVKRKIFGFFKSFNIELTQFNLNLYRYNITNYLLSQDAIDVDEIILGVYGTQEIDLNGVQTGNYLIFSPPVGVIPFYYLGWNLYGAITNVQNNVVTNNGFLYCQGPDMGPWNGVDENYTIGDVTEALDGSLWYCNETIDDTCNDCSPDDNCAWIPCINVVGSRPSVLNINFPLYQDIKDIGIYTDLIHPGIAEECSGSTKTLTQSYKCPVPWYVSNGGEVVFYDYETESEVFVERKCCEDYSEYGFVWWEKKCYKDYGNKDQGQGLELFNFPYDILFYGTGDNFTTFYEGPTLSPTQTYVNSGADGEIIGATGKRTLIYTPIISGLIDGETYIIKSKMVMQNYPSATLSNIMWGATSTLDPNWGYLYFENFELGEALAFTNPTSCIGANTTVSFFNGDYRVVTTNCNQATVNISISLEQGMTYKFTLRYLALFMPTIQNILTNTTDLKFTLRDPNFVLVLDEDLASGNIYDMEEEHTAVVSGAYKMQLQVFNPNGSSGCISTGTPCDGDDDSYGFGLEYLTVQEVPYNFTNDEDVKVTPIKYWTSNSYDAADGLVEVELESELKMEGATSVSLRLICDVKEEILLDHLEFDLITTEISFKYNQKPNFLGCDQTHFLNTIRNEYGSIENTIVPYVNTVVATDPQLPVISGVESNADCDFTPSVIGWYCDLGYVLEMGPPTGDITIQGCLSTSTTIPGVTLYSTPEECMLSSGCNLIVGCMDDTAINYNPQAQEPCWLNYYNDCCVLPLGGCTDIAANNYWPEATFDDGSCNYHNGCPDPTASNPCQPTNAITINSNIIGCTDCVGNPPPTQFNNPLYPNAIIPGTFGDITCCYFDPINNLPVGCTDFNATNYDALAIIDNGSCNYTVFYDVFCCFPLSPGSTCQEFNTTNVNDYNSFLSDSRCETTFNSCTTNNSNCI